MFSSGATLIFVTGTMAIGMTEVNIIWSIAVQLLDLIGICLKSNRLTIPFKR